MYDIVKYVCNYIRIRIVSLACADMVQELLNALHFAAIGGHLEVVKYLVPKFGNNKFDLDSHAQTCLHKAVMKGHPKVVRYLIEQEGYDPSLRDKVRILQPPLRSQQWCSTYLHVQDDLDSFLLACYHGQLTVVQELVNRHRMDPHVVNEVCAGVFMHVV